MKAVHLSPFEQEEYVLQERTPQMVRHLAECVACRDEVQQMEERLSLFRSAAVTWSAESLVRRPEPVSSGWRFAPRWGLAAMVPFLLLVLAFFALSRSNQPPAAPVAAMSDDALLDQVDQQLSVTVPSSMESLTHLVTADTGGRTSAQSY